MTPKPRSAGTSLSTLWSALFRISLPACLLLPLLACGCGSSVLEGDEPTDGMDIVIGFQDLSIRRDIADSSGQVADLPFVPQDLACPQECPDSAPCIETKNGNQCAIPCTQGLCPDGFTCVPNGAESICVSYVSRLCAPCNSDQECRTPGLNDDPAFCLSWAPEQGSFCSIYCSEEMPCPEGYQCMDSDGSSMCLPLTPTCACSSWATLNLATTTCARETSAGTCLGEVRCDSTGLTQCDAALPQPELCNGKDENCDGQTDEGFPDSDLDGIADCVDDPISVKPDLDQDGTPDDEDCSPGNAAIHPGAVEGCNGLDDNCDGEIDEGFPDSNADGYADCGAIDSDQDGTPDTQDCAPQNASVHPGATESCNSLDDDCDGITDPAGTSGCTKLYADYDGDGYGTSQDWLCLCQPDQPYTTVSSTDCNDSNASIHPGAAELCNGLDDDCSGSPEGPNTPGCKTWYIDADSDGYGSTSGQCLCAPTSTYKVQNNTDCNDADSTIHPGASELCNGKDDNCDSLTDPSGTCETGHSVCIDPGDGGTEPGAVGIVSEKTLNLSQALTIKQSLQADTAATGNGGSWIPLMTRESDTTVTLASRVEYANSNAAERFVSVHNNAGGGHGTETYTANAPSTNSTALATTAQTNLVALLALTNRGVKKNDFYVLVHTTMPAIMTFAGFVDSTTDMATLNTASGNSAVGNAILHALQTHFGFTVYTP